jgi:myo-inositol 2-dehydrogenase/D-chiro-inositol 1-dehydrogenase
VTGWDALAAFDLARAADLSWRTGQTVRAEARRTGAGVVYQMSEP